MTRGIEQAKQVVKYSAFAVILAAQAVMAEPKHGIAMYGEPQLPPDFKHLTYANPDAPKGGKIVFAERGGFDSLHPYIQKGRAPWGVRAHTVESLLGRNRDEPFALYGLLAETIETDDERKWVEFSLRPEATFSDGTPVTVEDVIWSFETLGTKGQARYQRTWQSLEKVEKTGDRKVKFWFNKVDRELALILGLRPILSKKSFEGRAFDESGLDPVVASGPYVVGKFEAGRYISFDLNPDYWGKDLPFNKGRHNVDEIRYEFFQEGTAAFEAFKTGASNFVRESSAANWERSYDFPRVKSGDVVKAEIPHQRPSGMRGIVLNSRKKKLEDWRVREALIHAFNFEFINQTINGGNQPRIQSYFSNSVLGMSTGVAEGKVKEYLSPFAADLLPGAMEGYSLPTSEGSARNRKNLAKAQELLSEAGWMVDQGVLKNAKGEPFELDFLIKTSATSNEAVANVYSDALKRLGIKTSITAVDDVQFSERRKSYNYDTIFNYWRLSLSPGNEQYFYWSQVGVTEPGTRNYMGANTPVIDSMIDEMLSARDQSDFEAATKALDRVLMSGRYVIPLWYSTVSRIAYAKELNFPEKLPIYGDDVGFMPDVWWVEGQ